MHYAFPQKGTRREPWAVKRKGFGRQGWQVIAASLGSVIIGLYLLSKLLGGFSSAQPEEDFTKAPFGQPNVVLVTTIDPHMHQSLTEAIKRNRMEYAERHGMHLPPIQTKRRYFSAGRTIATLRGRNVED